MYIQSENILLQWNEQKNEYLKATRKICFDDVEKAIHSGNILDIINHPNQVKYPGQKQMYILTNNYIYIVPYVETKNPHTIFLKTIYASRKITKKLRMKGKI